MSTITNGDQIQCWTTRTSFCLDFSPTDEVQMIRSGTTDHKYFPDLHLVIWKTTFDAPMKQSYHYTESQATEGAYLVSSKKEAEWQNKGELIFVSKQPVEKIMAVVQAKLLLKQLETGVDGATRNLFA